MQPKSKWSRMEDNPYTSPPMPPPRLPASQTRLAIVLLTNILYTRDLPGFFLQEIKPFFRMLNG